MVELRLPCQPQVSRPEASTAFSGIRANRPFPIFAHSSPSACCPLVAHPLTVQSHFSVENIALTFLEMADNMQATPDLQEHRGTGHSEVFFTVELPTRALNLFISTRLEVPSLSCRNRSKNIHSWVQLGLCGLGRAGGCGFLPLGG